MSTGEPGETETRIEFAVRVTWEDGQVETFERNALEYAKWYADIINESGGLTPPEYKRRRKGQAVVLRREVTLPPWEEVK